MLKTTYVLTAALIFASMVTGSFAHSQERDPAALPLNILPPKKPKPFTVGFRETYYLADQDTLLGAKHFEEVTGRVRGQSNSDFINTGIDIGGSFAINRPNYVSYFAPEAYFRFLIGSQPKSNSPLITIGRKKDRWSLLDSFWELGVWQPQYKWDYLRPEEQGLIGAFFELPRENVRWVFFLSPLYVPESGPSYRLKNHKLVSDNPWFFEPTEQLKVINTVTDVEYFPEIPRVEEIVEQFSAGTTVEVGARTAGWWGRLSYIYKPRNQIALPFSGVLRLGPPNSYIEVTILPKVQYHHVVAGDIGIKGQNFSTWFTTLYDAPVAQSFDSTLNYQTLYPTFFASPGIEYSETNPNGIGMGVILSYLYKNGRDPDETGPDVSSSNPVFGLPYNFTNAVRGAIRFSFPLKNELRSSLSLAYTENIDDQASWIKFVSEWPLTEQLKINAEGDLIGSLADRSDNHFLSRYRGNDRIIASGIYVF